MINKPVEERMAEFVRYHIEGDGECNNVVLREYGKAAGLGIEEVFTLSYFFAVTYCVESAVILFENTDKIVADPLRAARELKPRMIFQSDRKYVKMRDTFQRMLVDFSSRLFGHGKEFVERFNSKGVFELESAIEVVEGWFFFGRFSAYLFLETLAGGLGLKVENTTIDWPNGDTATSGLLNLIGFDEAANVFDAGKGLPVNRKALDAQLFMLADRVNAAGGDSNTTQLETSLCAYRKFYKGSRYNGFYLDRMLEELLWYRNNYPEYDRITNALFDIRARCYSKAALGELSGWAGIRRDRKKLYKETGVIEWT